MQTLQEMVLGPRSHVPTCLIWVGCFWLSISLTTADGQHLGLQSCEDLTRGSAANMVPASDWQVNAGCGQEPLEASRATPETLQVDAGDRGGGGSREEELALAVGGTPRSAVTELSL